MKVATIAVLLVLISAAAGAQVALTENTVRLARDAEPGAGSVDDFAWLVGRWTGSGLGGSIEEVWTEAEGGKLLGMFRLVREGKPSFYEILTLGEFDGRLALRLKHVNPDMTGWEQREKFVEFEWVGAIGGDLHFGGLAFRREGKDAMTIFLALHQGGSVREHVLKMTRAPLGPPVPEPPAFP
ncbi:MAG TPA: DUF6265 family protein [Thermoanaerobaculia bacterium]|nr:DUF6265 family protein [Thermoanaerobaculia bacterium]